MSELKPLPCPFCGGKAHIQGHGYETEDYRVYCEKCECSTPMWSGSKDKAIDIWNRRAEKAEAERDKAAEFIRWVDDNFSRYMPQEYIDRLMALECGHFKPLKGA